MNTKPLVPAELTEEERTIWIAAYAAAYVRQRLDTVAYFQSNLGALKGHVHRNPMSRRSRNVGWCQEPDLAYDPHVCRESNYDDPLSLGAHQ